MEEFEKLLTAVHTRGLENVESPENEEENQKSGSSEMPALRMPLPARGRAKSRRGRWFNGYDSKGEGHINVST